MYHDGGVDHSHVYLLGCGFRTACRRLLHVMRSHLLLLSLELDYRCHVDAI